MQQRQHIARQPEKADQTAVQEGDVDVKPEARHGGEQVRQHQQNAARCGVDADFPDPADGRGEQLDEQHHGHDGHDDGKNAFHIFPPQKIDNCPGNGHTRLGHGSEPRHCVQMRSGRPNRIERFHRFVSSVSRGRCESRDGRAACPPLHILYDTGENYNRLPKFFGSRLDVS